MDSQGVSRDGAVNRSMDRDEIEIEDGRSRSSDHPISSQHSHSRGQSESQTLLQDIESGGIQSPRRPISHSHSRSRGLSESQNLIPNVSKNLFEYSNTKELTGYQYNQPETPRPESPMWTGVPQTLRTYRKEKLQMMLMDILAIGSSFPLFALAGYLIWFDGKDVTEHQLNALNECIKAVSLLMLKYGKSNPMQTSTFLPLLFSVVVGRATIKFASWKLERGTSLGLMEQLMGSRTMGGTIITSITLRSWTFLSAALIALWLFSPAGSQAILRILSTDAIGNAATSPANLNTALGVSYVNMRQPSQAASVSFDAWFSSFASIFSAALFSPASVKSGSMDLWGNVKIPFFSSLSNFSQDANGWKQIPQNFTPTYSSLFGIPAAALPEGNTTFNIESSYMELSCANRTSTRARSNGTFIDPGLISTNGPFKSAQNTTSSTAWEIGYLGDDLTSLLPNSSIQSIDSLPSNTTSQTFLPGLLLYQDFTGASNVTSIFCTPTQTYIENVIACTKSSASSSPSCVVTAQRLSLLPHMPTTITLFSFLDTFVGTSFLLPFSEPQVNSIDPIQNYIVDPLSNSFIQSTTFASVTGEESRFLNISLADFGTRLGQVLNTFLQGSMANSTSFLLDPNTAFASVANPGIASSPSLLSSQITSLSNILTAPSNTTTATVQLGTALKLHLSVPYLAIFLLSSLLILLAAVLSAILSRRTIARDYLPYVSSLARESQYINFPPGGVGLSGMARTRAMKELRIQLGDQGEVEGGFEIGTGVRLAVGVLALGEKSETGSLGRRKLYL